MNSTDIIEELMDLSDFSGTLAGWISTQILPDFTDWDAYKNRVQSMNKITASIKTGFQRGWSTLESTLHGDDVDTSTPESIESACCEFQKECLLHIETILNILETEHEFPIKVPFEIPASNGGAGKTYDRFGQPDIMMMPIQQTLKSFGTQSGKEPSQRAFWIMSCCICLTCHMHIYHEIDSLRRTVRQATSSGTMPEKLKRITGKEFDVLIGNPENSIPLESFAYCEFYAASDDSHACMIMQVPGENEYVFAIHAKGSEERLVHEMGFSSIETAREKMIKAFWTVK